MTELLSEADEFVRVVAPKTAHRVDEQGVCQG